MTHFQRNGYMGAKRKALVERYGYDVKNAAHCVRLLMQGIALAKADRVVVRWTRSRAATLIDIKRGGVSLSDVHEKAERLFAEFNVEREHSELPGAPDMEKCSAIVRDVIMRAAEGR